MSSNVIVFRRAEISQPSFEPMAKSHRLLEFWRTRCTSGALPELQSLSLAELPDLMADLWMVKYAPDCHRFRYIMAGARISEAIGKAATGHWLDAVFPFMRPGHPDYEDLETVITTGKPRATFGVGSSLETPRSSTQESLYLPIAEAGSVTTILAITDCRNHLGQDYAASPFLNY